MKKLFILLFAGVFSHNCLAMPVLVKYIVDGDTFVGDVLSGDNIEIRSVSIRLRNVDTPEIHGQCEEEIKRAEYAKQRLGELIPVGSKVEIDNIKNDKYAGRIDANVYDANNRDVGSVLIHEKVGRKYNGGKRESWCK